MAQYTSIGNLFTIYKESVPQWYKISFDFVSKSFEFIVQKQIAEWCEENFINKNFGHVQGYCKDFGFEFTKPFKNQNWGFNKNISAKKIINQNWVKYKIKIPTKNYYQGIPVFTQKSNKQILATCASISEFALMLGCVPFDLPIDYGQKQVLHFYSSLNSDVGALNRFPVSAYVSSSVCEWALLAGQDNLNILAYNIDKVENIICGYQNYSERPRAWINLISDFYIGINIGVHLGMSPNMHNAKASNYDIGYTLVSDNADNCTNQLILMCSLALLHNEVEVCSTEVWG